MIIWFFFYIPLAIFCLALAAFVVSRLMHKSSAANISECVIWWMTISLVLPFRAKKLGVLSKYLPGWILTFLSPAAFVTYFLIWTIVVEKNPLPYDHLQFTTRPELLGITELPDIPPYEYQTNEKDIDYDRRIKFTFKYEKSVDWLLSYLSRTVSNENNVYWRKDSISSQEDRDFFGTGSVYVLERGWDSLYVRMPRNINCKDMQVKIVIGRKGFTVSSNTNWTGRMDSYAVPDSLEKLTGIKFPPFTFVNKHCEDNFQDYSVQITINMHQKPSKAMIDSIENACSKAEKMDETKCNGFWSKLTDGTYSFCMDNFKGFKQYVDINPNSRFATIFYESY